MFRSARHKTVALAAIAAAGEAVGVWMLLGGGSMGLGAGLLVTIFFGIALLGLLERILRPAVVVLTRDAIRMSGPGGPTTVRWEDIVDMAVVRSGRSWLVAYRLRDEAQAVDAEAGGQLVARTNALLTGGYHGTIAGSRLPVNAYDLHKVLDWYWQRPRERRRLPE